MTEKAVNRFGENVVTRVPHDLTTREHGGHTLRTGSREVVDRDRLDTQAVRQAQSGAKQPNAYTGHTFLNRTQRLNLDGHKLLFHLANRLHVTTRPRVVEQKLLFDTGDPYDPRLLRETARHLRSQGYLYDASIRPIRYRDGRVDILVVTRDVWTLSLGADVTERRRAEQARDDVARDLERSVRDLENLKQRLEEENLLLREAAGEEARPSSIVGSSPGLTATDYRYTLPSRFDPNTNLRAINVMKEADEDGPLYEEVVFP